MLRRQTWIALIFLLGAAVVWLVVAPLPVEHYARYDSSDGRFAVVVYRQPSRFAMPGQASDAPGYVVLQTAQGRELHRADLEMVQLASPPRWQETRVSMKLIFDWPLP